jgi:hypothetical protein
MFSMAKPNGGQGRIRWQKKRRTMPVPGHKETPAEGDQSQSIEAEKSRGQDGDAPAISILAAGQIEKERSRVGTNGAEWLETAVAVSQEHFVERK